MNRKATNKRPEDIQKPDPPPAPPKVPEHIVGMQKPPTKKRPGRTIDFDYWYHANGTPKHIEVYELGSRTNAFDPYTCVFPTLTEKYEGKPREYYIGICRDGSYYHGEHCYAIHGKPNYGKVVPLLFLDERVINTVCSYYHDNIVKEKSDAI